MSTKTKVYQFTGGIVTESKLAEVLKDYISTADNAELVSWIEPTETGIKVYMKDGTTEELTISQAKEFETPDFDKETGYFHFYDAQGNDVYDPVYIGTGGGESASSSVVTLTNQNGTATFAIPSGTSLNLMFNFTSTENDVATGNGTCQITVNGAIKSTFSIEQGLTTVDVAPYLNSGSNTVRVRCTDIYGTYKTLIYTVSVIDMYITSTFDATAPYSGDITYKYTAYGSIEKTIHILVDGTEVNTTVISTSGKQSTYIISALSHGVHRLEVYATAELDDIPMESEPLIYDVICTESGNSSAMIASAFGITSVKQGEQVSIPHIVYDPTRLACDITREIYTMSSGSEVIYSSQDLTVDREQYIWNTRKYPVGTVYFRIKYGQISKTHMIEVTESDIQVEAETNDLELALLSDGRSNNEANPGTWTYGDYSTIFENFNWKTNGWIDDENGDACLRLNGDARAEIQFQPFKDDIRTYGKTIELEFTIRDVNNRNATVISCLSGGIGFEVTADTAYLKSEQSRVFCKYKEDDDDDDVIDKVRIAFVVEARSEYRRLCIYLNGILSKEIQYPDTDNFQQSSPVTITIGSSSCGVDLYTVRSYSTALTGQSVLNNCIADIKDIVEKSKWYERNDIYDEYGNVSFEKCKAKNSVMVIIGELPTAKGDKKNVKIAYYDINDSTLSFIDAIVVIDVQGTSSQFYVRKNWKLKCSTEHAIDLMQVLTKVFCIKVDYAEATGKHNTGNANFVHTLYDEPIPPQEDNSLTRTTIYGKPILLFHQVDENSDPVFYGKANFNFDKGSLEAFGFTEDYDVECWEFCNNTSDACNFLGPVPTIWVDDFEARYPDDYTDISRFKLMHDWVVSTNQNGATGESLNEAYTDIDGNTYTNDTAEYRLAKFKTEFEDHFNMHYSLIYYVYTFFALMVDQRAKNMFLTYWGKTGKWYPYFYDNDTCFGINNEGQLVFDYYHTDTDQIEGANVYNGQNSVLWNNVRMAFPDKIKETYQNLRNSGKLTFKKMKDNFITNHSDKWSEAIYNEDAYFKYIQMLIEDNDATNLSQIRGEAAEHFEYLVGNRFDFCDSKWYSGEYVSNYISLRIYTPSEWTGVKPNADITTTYFSTIYAGVRYKANGTLYQEKVEAGVPVTFNAPDETFNDTETAVYGAHLVSSLGDLAPLYSGSINVSAADKLIELKVGDSTEGYSNPNLKELSIGTNKLMRKVNVCNCPNFTSVLDLSNCPSIEEVYATGSGITGVNFPEAGILRTAKLPATITNFTLKHQLYVEELTFEGHDNIKTLWIEDCPTIDGLEILNNSTNVERLRLTDVDWKYDTAADMLALAGRDLKGIDENGANIDVMWIDGTCHIKTLTGADYLTIKNAFPYLTITYDVLTSELVYMSEDGTTELARQTIQNGGDGSYSGTTPTKASTVQYRYTFAGWSLTPGGSVDANALKAVEADRVVYAVFSSTVRTYTVKFYNGTTLLQTVTEVPYGGTATYTGDTPTNDSTGDTSDFEFYGWSPSPTNIQGDTSCYAQYHDLREIEDSWATIAANVANGTAESLYAVGSFKTLNLGEKELPYDFYSGSAVIYNDEIHILGSGSSSSYQKYHYKWDGAEWIEASTLPYSFCSALAVVYNNEIHILGSYASSYQKYHYKWNGSEWTEVSTLPYEFYQGSAVVLNDEIHILGSYASSSYYTHHYKWDGAEWTEASTLPYNFYYGEAVVYNDEIHIMGGYLGSNYTSHYKWDGIEWTEVSTLSYDFCLGSAIVYDNEIHILGSNYSSYYRKYHYKWDGSEWTEVSTLSYDFYNGYAVVYNNEIHILGSSATGYRTAFYHYSTESATWSKYVTETIPMQVVAHNHDELTDGTRKWESSGTLPYKFYQGLAVVYDNEIHILGSVHNSYRKYHYKWNGTEWVSVSTLPYDFYQGLAVVYNDEIHILGTYETSYRKYHYKWNGTEWVSVSTLPYDFYNGYAVVYDNEIHILGSVNNSYRKYHYKWNGTEWTEVSTLPYDFYNGYAVVYDNEIHILGSYASSYRKYHYKWNGTEWTEVSTLPYEFYQGSAVVYDNEIHILGSYASSYQKYHYKWNGTEWVSVSTLPYSFCQGSAVVYDNKISIMGGYLGSKNNEFKQLCGPKFEQVLTMSLTDTKGTHQMRVAGEYNGLLYMITNNFNILSFDGSSYNVVAKIQDYISDLKSVDGATCVLIDNIIYFHRYTTDTTLSYYHKLYGYDIDANTVTEISSETPDFAAGHQLINYNGELHSIRYTMHYKWDGATWTQIDMSNIKNVTAVCVYDDKIYGFINDYYVCTYDGSTWTELVNNDNTSSQIGRTTPHPNGIYAIASSEATPSVYNRLVNWNGTEWEEVLSNVDVFDGYGSMAYYKSSLYRISGLANACHNKILVLTNQKATLTFVAGNLLSEARLFYDSETVSTGWPGSSMRSWCKNTLFALLPSELQSVIASVKKYSDGGYLSPTITVTDDNIWLLSMDEIGAEHENHITGQGLCYSVFTDATSRIKSTVDGGKQMYYLRSTNTKSTVQVYYVKDFDGGINASDGLTVKRYVLIGFCI